MFSIYPNSLPGSPPAAIAITSQLSYCRSLHDAPLLVTADWEPPSMAEHLIKSFPYSEATQLGPVDLWQRVCEYLKALRSGLSGYLSPSWKTITIALCPCLFLRNTAHFLNCDPARMDIRIPRSHRNLAPPVFSVHTAVIQDVLDHLIRTLASMRDMDRAFSRTFEAFRVGYYEAGEISFPNYPHLDWSSVGNAAIVCPVGWPEAECADLMQSLFYGRYFGDKSGIFLSMIHP